MRGCISFTVFVGLAVPEIDEIWQQMSRRGAAEGDETLQFYRGALLYVTTQTDERWPRSSPPRMPKKLLSCPQSCTKSDSGFCAVASPNIFVFCDSSCCRSVTATRTLFMWCYFMSLCTRQIIFVQFCALLPLH